MPTVKLSACAVAHLLQQQPSQAYDCSALNIEVSIRPSAPSLQVSQLQMVSLFDPMSCSYELNIAISSITNPTTFFHLSSASLDAYLVVNDEEPASNAFLQAIPTIPLFPPEHPLHSSHQIPIHAPYTCTLYETHQLLLSHIDNLPEETIQGWTWPIIVSTLLTWPTEKPYPITIDAYHLVMPSNTDKIADMPFFPQSSRNPRPLYLMRNTLILQSIFPEISSLCAWACRVSPAQPPTPIGNGSLPPGSNEHHILAAPLLPPHSPILQGTQLFPLSDLFPPDFSHPPEDPLLCPSPSEILQKINQTIHQTQVNSLTC